MEGVVRGVMAFLSAIPLILVAIAMLVIVRGQQRAQQAQAKALRAFIERVTSLGR